MTSTADTDSTHPKKSVILKDGEFIDLLEQRAGNLLSIARFLSARQPRASAFTRPLVADLLAQSLLVEELLDIYGARNNRQWCRFRSLVATIKLFAEVSYELLHIHHCLPSCLLYTSRCV